MMMMMINDNIMFSSLETLQMYQSSLLEYITKEIKKLDSLIKYYQDSESARMATLYDIPEIGGRIIWSQQMESHLNRLMSKVKVILGEDWDQLNEGRKITVC